MTLPIDTSSSASELAVGYVPTAHLPALWPYVELAIAAACEHAHGTYSAADIKQALLAEQMQLWVVHQSGEILAACVVEVTNWPGKRGLMIVCLGGRQMNDWADLLELKLRRYAKQVGAAALVANCRPGMAKYLAKRGWKKTFTVMELD